MKNSGIRAPKVILGHPRSLIIWVKIGFKLIEFSRVKNVEASSCLLTWRPPMMNNSDFVNIEVEYKKQGMWIKTVKHRLNSTISSMPLNQLKPGVRISSVFW